MFRDSSSFLPRARKRLINYPDSGTCMCCNPPRNRISILLWVIGIQKQTSRHGHALMHFVKGINVALKTCRKQKKPDYSRPCTQISRPITSLHAEHERETEKNRNVWFSLFFVKGVVLAGVSLLWRWGAAKINCGHRGSQRAKPDNFCCPVSLFLKLNIETGKSENQNQFLIITARFFVEIFPDFFPKNLTNLSCFAF